MTGLRKKRKAIFMIICITAVMVACSLSVSADMGPKPSVRIIFENLGDDLCYGTLLSVKESTGPSTAWNGIEEDARHNENPNGYYSYLTFGYDIWKAFVDYAETDDFYFLQEAWKVNETKELAWTYYPPDEFKILLYFPESGEFLVSDICKRYAFDSYFTVNMDGVSLSADYNEEMSTDARMTAYKSYNYGKEIISLVMRIIITIAIEMAAALLFGFRKKKQLLLLAGVNTATQIMLNVLLNIINYNSGEMAFVMFYVLLEFAVFIIEAILYCRVMRKADSVQKSKWFYVLYAFLANGVSFGAGIAAAQIIPGIF